MTKELDRLKKEEDENMQKMEKQMYGNVFEQQKNEDGTDEE